MAQQRRANQFEVSEPTGSDYLQIIETTSRDVVALVTAPRKADAYLMASAPEMYGLLSVLAALPKNSDGGSHLPLLPAHALTSIAVLQRRARGEA